MAEYEVVYNVGLLDDIHNYFPSLLYDMDRFQNIQQVFHYVRQEMGARFNLMRYGASLAGARSSQIPPPINIPMRNRNTVETQLNFRREFPADIFLRAFAGDFTDGFAGFTGLEPVVIRPSAEVIASSTEMIAGSTLAEGTLCSICQDTIINTDSARRIRACGHLYHQGCIDRWFESSVFCPQCRHDVRT